MHRTLTIPEIIHEIIRHADRNTAVTCARVCRLWSEMAIDDTWNALDGNRALGVLIELEKTTAMSGKKSYDKIERRGDRKQLHKRSTINEHRSATQIHNWTRFAFYTCRVRSATICINSRNYEETIQFLLRNPMQAILPRLRVLRLDVLWSNARLSIIAKFLSPSLKSLTLDLSGDLPHEPICTLGRDLVARSPHLTHLSLYGDCGLRRTNLMNEVLHALNGLHDLRHVELGGFAIARSVVRAISRKRRLSRLAVREERDVHWQTRRIFQEEMRAMVISDALPALTELELRSDWADVVATLRSHSCFGRLRKLSLKFINASSERDLSELLSCVVETCPQLEELSIEQFYDAWEQRRITGTISLKTISKLENLKYVTSLTLHHVLANTLSDEDLVELVRMCPRLEKLWLIPQWIPADTLTLKDNVGAWSSGVRPPTSMLVLPRSKMTLRVLALLARQPNVLRSLRICFEVHNPKETPAIVSQMFNTHLHDLRYVGLGLSPILLDEFDEESLARVSKFLSNCLPRDCERLDENDWLSQSEELGGRDQCFEEEPLEQSRENTRKWDRVWEMLTNRDQYTRAVLPD